MDELVEPPSDEAWESYGRVNANVAAAVLEELEEDPDTPVWFHDYHLYLAPAAVRAARPDATLSHFVHIPWPRPDDWSLLPAEWSRALHEGLLANDVVGFHTHRWREPLPRLGRGDSRRRSTCRLVTRASDLRRPARVRRARPERRGARRGP